LRSCVASARYRLASSRFANLPKCSTNAPNISPCSESSDTTSATVAMDSIRQTTTAKILVVVNRPLFGNRISTLRKHRHDDCMYLCRRPGRRQSTQVSIATDRVVQESRSGREYTVIKITSLAGKVPPTSSNRILGIRRHQRINDRLTRFRRSPRERPSRESEYLPSAWRNRI